MWKFWPLTLPSLPAAHALLLLIATTPVSWFRSLVAPEHVVTCCPVRQGAGSEGNVNGQNFHIPYVEHWNGTAWSLVKTPNRGGEGSLLNGITALGAGDVWAVGQTQQLNGAIMPMTDQFNGTSWSVVPSPVPGSSGRIPDDSLDGAASLGGGLVFAVGARDIPGQCCLRTLGLKTSAG